jgi:hypothetical protein
MTNDRIAFNSVTEGERHSSEPLSVIPALSARRGIALDVIDEMGALVNDRAQHPRRQIPRRLARIGCRVDEDLAYLAPMVAPASRLE